MTENSSSSSKYVVASRDDSDYTTWTAAELAERFTLARFPPLR